MAEGREFSADHAGRIGDVLGTDRSMVDQEQVGMGLAVEIGHGAHDDPLLTGKIA